MFIGGGKSVSGAAKNNPNFKTLEFADKKSKGDKKFILAAVKQDARINT